MYCMDNFAYLPTIKRELLFELDPLITIDLKSCILRYQEAFGGVGRMPIRKAVLRPDTGNR